MGRPPWRPRQHRRLSAGGHGRSVVLFWRSYDGRPRRDAPTTWQARRNFPVENRAEMKVKRREFVRDAVAVSAGLLMARGAGFAQTSRSGDSRIEVLLSEEIGTIIPDIYGHFAEHLGGVVYDGMWVGENSKVPNTGGIRTALIDALKRIKAPVVRWPGGCFADSYDWRDGTGPRDKRPRRTNFWVDAPEWPAGAPDGPWKYEPNHFGINEFMRFCQLSGAEPYLRRMYADWERRSFTSGLSMSTLRREQPRGLICARMVPQETGIRTKFASGESATSPGAAAGNFTPEEYAAEYRRFTAAVPRYGVDLKFIASGANVDDFNWTRGFFSKTAEKGGGFLFNGIYGWGLHHYAWNLGLGRTNDWFAAKGDALKFDTAEYYELLREADRMESLINQHWTIMGQYDRQHRVKLVVDEWGAWYKKGSEVHPSHLLGQQSTMRDAVLAGLTLDTFNRHADKVAMANVAQLINSLHSLFSRTATEFILTPTLRLRDVHAAHGWKGRTCSCKCAGGAVHARRQAGRVLGTWGIRHL